MKRAICASILLLFLLSPAGALAQSPAPVSTLPSAAAPRQPVGTNGTKPAADVDADYRLGPGDKLRVEVYKDAQLSQSLQVRPDGKITLPLVGDLAASGRTAVQLRDHIAESLKAYITTPTVTVIVVEAVPKMVYVMGEVNTPGPQELKPQLDIFQALATAGGFKDFANPKKIVIRRRMTSGATQDIQFNYKDALKNGGKPLYLQAGDTVIVP
jgi:polysaccharide biosynthesis/export protein